MTVVRDRRAVIPSHLRPSGLVLHCPTGSVRPGHRLALRLPSCYFLRLLNPLPLLILAHQLHGRGEVIALVRNRTQVVHGASLDRLIMLPLDQRRVQPLSFIARKDIMMRT